MASSTTLTVLVTDLVASTAFRHARGDLPAHEEIAAADSQVTTIVSSLGGHVVKSTGDGLLIVFDSARGGLTAAIEIQRQGQHPEFSGSYAPLTLRAGLHTGEAIRDNDDVFGVAVDAAFRINARAKGQQILVSEMVRGVLGGASEFSFLEKGRHRLKGFAGSWRLYEVPWRPAQELAVHRSWAFMFCDMIGSTPMAFERDEHETYLVMRALNAIIRSSASAHAAIATQLLGDGGMAVFDSVEDAIQCAVDIQSGCQMYREGAGEPIPMRVGINVGNAIREAGEFYGRALFLASRIVSAAQAAEILLTDEARAAITSDGVEFGVPRVETLRGVPDARTVHPLMWRSPV